MYDSGCTHHTTPNLGDIDTLRESSLTGMYVADERLVPIHGEGECTLPGLHGPAVLRNVQYAPEFTCALLSRSQVYKDGGKIVESDTGEFVEIYLDRRQPRPSLIARWDGNLCFVELPSGAAATCLGAVRSAVLGPCSGVAAPVRGESLRSSKASWKVWHSRLGLIGGGNSPGVPLIPERNPRPRTNQATTRRKRELGVRKEVANKGGRRKSRGGPRTKRERELPSALRPRGSSPSIPRTARRQRANAQASRARKQGGQSRRTLTAYPKLYFFLFT
jgi:hypothetical protein